MNKNLRPLVRTATAAALLTYATACGDRSTVTGLRDAPSAASRVLSDGANGANDDVFFMPPTVATDPHGKPGFGDPVQAGLPVGFRIRDMSVGGTPIVKEFLPAAVSYCFGSSGGNGNGNGNSGNNGNNGNMKCDDSGKKNSSDASYQAQWDTKNSGLNSAHNYRLQVVIGAVIAAYGDIDVVESTNELKNVDEAHFIGLRNGKSLTIAVRVEKGWYCKSNPACVVEVVPNNIPVGQKVIVQSNDHNNAAAFTGTWHAGDFPVMVTIEDVSSTVGGAPGGCAQGLTSMLTNNHCVHITVVPAVTLTAPVIVATCLPNPGDPRQLLVKYDVDETTRYLDDAIPPIVCPEAIGYTGHSKNPFIRLASAAMTKVSKGFRWATGTKPAYAIDLGVGGRLEVGDEFSYFALGLPAEFQAVSAQTFSLPVSNVADVVSVRLHALHHSTADPYVTTSTVTCSIESGGGTFTTEGHPTSATANFDSESNRYYCPPWLRPSTGGVGTLKVKSNKLDNSFLFPGEVGYDTYFGSMTFTATALADLPCSAEPTTHSLNGDSGLLPITFNNQSGETVRVYWLDYSGARVLYLTLENSTSFTQLTYITHPWIMIGASSNTCYGIRMPITGGRTVVIN